MGSRWRAENNFNALLAQARRFPVGKTEIFWWLKDNPSADQIAKDLEEQLGEKFKVTRDTQRDCELIQVTRLR